MKKTIPIILVAVVAVVIVAVALLMVKPPTGKPGETVSETTPTVATPTPTPTVVETPVRTLKLTGNCSLINETGRYRLEFNLRFEGEVYVINVTFEPKGYGRNITLIGEGFQVSGVEFRRINYPIDLELYEYIFNRRRIYVYVAYAIDDKIEYIRTEIFATIPTTRS